MALVMNQKTGKYEDTENPAATAMLAGKPELSTTGYGVPYEESDLLSKIMSGGQYSQSSDVKDIMSPSQNIPTEKPATPKARLCNR
jgi:hypothetical protein